MIAALALCDTEKKATADDLLDKDIAAERCHDH